MQRFLISLTPRLRLLRSLYPALDSAGVTHQGVISRGFSQKNIIRWPKNPPRSDSVSQTGKGKSAKLKIAGRRKADETADRVSSKSVRVSSTTRGLESGGDIMDGAEHGYEGNDHHQIDGGTHDEEGLFREEEIVDTNFGENEAERNRPLLHFDGEDVGFRGTYVLGGGRIVTTNADSPKIAESLLGDNVPNLEREQQLIISDFTESEHGGASATVTHDDDSQGLRRHQSTSAIRTTSTDHSSQQLDTDFMPDKIRSWVEAQRSGRSDGSSYRRKKQPEIDMKSYSKPPRISSKNEILYGISPCLLALQQNRRVVSKGFVLGAFVNSARPEAQEIAKILNDRGVAMHEMSRGQLNKLANGRPHQGVCLEVSPLHLESLSRISGELIAVPENSKACILALDQILDPMNLGAVMRSAYFLGVDWMVASKYKCCPLTSTVSKASSGVAEVMSVYAARSMEDFLKELSSHGWQILGATNRESMEDNDQRPVASCMDVRITRPTVLVVGSEGFGLRPSLESYCDSFVTVSPGRALHRNIDSLNVSVATGILLHSLLADR